MCIYIYTYIHIYIYMYIYIDGSRTSVDGLIANIPIVTMPTGTVSSLFFFVFQTFTDNFMFSYIIAFFDTTHNCSCSILPLDISPLLPY
jgi:hypothetical protein